MRAIPVGEPFRVGTHFVLVTVWYSNNKTCEGKENYVYNEIINVYEILYVCRSDVPGEA